MRLTIDLWFPDRRRDALLARLLAPSLDRKLAAGRSPESHPLLAIRAQALVAPDMRGTLARTLAEVVEKGSRPRQTGGRRIKLCHDRIVAAESDLREMMAYLSGPLPMPARAVAMVTSMLRDGMGPLYNPNCTSDLCLVVREAIEALNPSLELDLSAWG